MNAPVNRQWSLTARPVGMPKRSDFTWAELAVPEPGEGQVLVRTHYISLDPAMRGWMNDARSYIAPIQLGEVMRAGAVGEVVASKSASVPEGSFVVGMFGMQDYAVADAKAVTPVDPKLAPLPLYLSALGMPGMTAYFGLLDVGAPQAGQTVVVSAAGGAVGALVGQIARLDGVIDYKNEDVGRGLSAHCPQGIDVYFDNVGGDILDAALARLARHARVVICGAISQYNAGAVAGPRNYLSLLVQHARMEGFVVFDYAARYGEGLAAMAGWLQDGSLKSKEDIVVGLERFPETLLKLFTGENFGKLMIKAV
jgi:NADPH-dependent curcumin reductase CurA